MLLGLGWWLTGIASDDGSVGLALVFDFHDGFDAGPNRSGSAFVRSACDEIIELGEERPGKAYRDLFRGHPESIPIRYAYRYVDLVASSWVSQRRWLPRMVGRTIVDPTRGR